MGYVVWLQVLEREKDGEEVGGKVPGYTDLVNKHDKVISSNISNMNSDFF